MRKSELAVWGRVPGWIELLGGTNRADLFERALKSERLFVPAIVRYEVERYVLAHSGEMAKFEQVAVDAAVARSCEAHF